MFHTKLEIPVLFSMLCMTSLWGETSSPSQAIALPETGEAIALPQEQKEHSAAEKPQHLISSSSKPTEKHFQQVQMSLSAGYLWSTSHRFHEVYGHGMAVAILADVSYWFYPFLSVGTQTGQWQSSGHTTRNHEPCDLRQVPLIVYLKGQLGKTVQWYGSFGLGGLFSKEHAPWGTARHNVFGAQLETGVNYFFVKNFYLTGAFQYLLFRKHIQYVGKIDFGGCTLRGGLGVAF
jgi:hypothetical protein